MPYPEFNALLDHLAVLFFDLRTGSLLLLLAVAAVFDFRFHRIPNWLVVSGALFGVIYNTAMPESISDNILTPLAGIGVGLLLFLPLYALRAMGAGDVKLLAMTGAFVGAGATLRVALLSVLVGGVLSIVYVLVKRTAPKMVRNLVSVFQLSILNVLGGSAPSFRIAVDKSAGKLPFGVAILLGTFTYLVLHQLNS